MALKRIVFGAAILSAARVFQMAASFLTVPILARILTPADYGLVAMALAVIGFSLYLGDAGLGRSLMRTSAEDETAWSSAHWMVSLCAGAIGLVLVAAAWPASLFFNEPRLTWVMMALAAVPVMFGFSAIPAQYLFQRERFGWLALGEFASALAGAGFALWLAFSGAGVWALVAQSLAVQGVNSAIIIVSSGFRPRLVLSLPALRPHARFSIDSLGFAVTTFISRQTDPLVIGKVLGATTLGFYSIAYRVMQLPSYAIAAPVQGALYPRLALLKDDKPALKQVALAATTILAAFVFPPMAAIAVASHAVFTLLLSERWASTAPLFTALAIAGMMQTITMLNGPFLQAVGRTGARLRITVEFAILWVLGALVLVHFGIQTLAWGFSAITLLYLPRLLITFLRPLECTLLEYLKALAAPIAAALGVVAAHLALRSLLGLGLWWEAGLAALETLLGWGLFLALERRAIVERLKLVSAILRGEPGTPLQQD